MATRGRGRRSWFRRGRCSTRPVDLAGMPSSSMLDERRAGAGPSSRREEGHLRAGGEEVERSSRTSMDRGKAKGSFRGGGISEPRSRAASVIASPHLTGSGACTWQKTGVQPHHRPFCGSG